MVDARHGLTIWLTGLSGAGKTTLAEALAARLAGQGDVTLLDGDAIRSSLSSDLGFSRQDRETNTRRLGAIASYLSEQGRIVVVAAISPYRGIREQVRSWHRAPFVEIFVECGMEELIRRDPKGLYRRALRGELPSFTGVSDPYEAPTAQDVHVRTDVETREESIAKVWGYLRERRLVDHG